MNTGREPEVPASADGCAARAEIRGDPMLGTAFPASRLLLVEQPGPWGRAGLSGSRFDARVARELERAAVEASVRVLAIRRIGRSPRGEPRRWFLVDCRSGHRSVRSGTYTEDAELLDFASDDTIGGDVVEGPLHLVCAHSKHDACCALRGRPVAAALAAVRPGQVWECSHLGGDRFAANVLVLPHGLLYGRVLPDSAQEFAEAADDGVVLASLLRGRVGFAPVVQAALAYAHGELAVTNLDELGFVETRDREGGAVVRLSTPRGPVDVTVSVTRSAADLLTCQATGPSRYLIHRPVQLVRVG